MRAMLTAIFELAFPNPDRKEPFVWTASSWITLAILGLALALVIGILIPYVRTIYPND